MPVFVWNILSRRLASSPSRIFEVSLEFTKKKKKKKKSLRCCDLSIRARQDDYYTVQWIDCAQNSSTIPKNLDFEESYHYSTSLQSRCITRLILIISVTFPSISYMIYTKKMISAKQRAKHVYPVLEMLSNKMKRLKMRKIKFENLKKKNPELRHLPTNHPLSSSHSFA